ncbi:MAG: hypothetical protein KDC38_12915 [Planctomycetes bacterium]|nr:hypothetical protein [Planctomycetota bacterium]
MSLSKALLFMVILSWLGFVVLEAEAADYCAFNPTTYINKSTLSNCSLVLSDNTTFSDCPCVIELDVSLYVYSCAQFAVSVNGNWIPNPSPTWYQLFSLNCNESYHAFATVTCSNSCGGVSKSFIVAEYLGDCDQPCGET